MRRPNQAPDWMRRHQNVLPLELDVTDRGSVARCVEETIGRFGRIDVLLNNAGYGLNGPMEGATDAQKRRQFDVNVFGLIDVTNAVLPHMRSQRAGLIINISSIGGLIGMPISPLYIATKHAVEGLSESMRYELKPFGVRVKLVEPGGVRTDFIERSSVWTDHPDYTAHIKAAKKMAAELDSGLADPIDIARVIYKAATDPSDRLRYLAKPGPFIALYRMLPDSLWRRLIQWALARHGRSNASR